ncbi:MAG: InlB B-repeat-containing protein, partial [Lachnospiraceae bacterium]|nr:InlB B-repeat-containing protein [Lachnospiraceae bacterium]
ESSIKKTASGTLSYGDLSQYADMRVVSTPSVYSSGCNTSYGTPRVFASAVGGRTEGNVKLELCVYVENWSGPGDNDVPPYLEPSMRFADDDRYKTVTVSSTDPISYYYYTYDDSSYNYTVSYGSYGSGSSFAQSVDLSNAGKYCHVTFYTQSGASCSTVIKVPDAVNLTYNLNGGTGTTPSSQKVWAGQSVRIASNSSTRTNCEFLGWSTTKYDVLEYGKTVSNLLSPGTAYTLNSNTTLYAVWRTIKVPYTINFTLNGKPAKNDFAYITGYVNGGTRVTQSREFSYLEIPGYTVSAKIKSSDENVFLMVGDNKSPGYEYTIPTKTINTGTTDTVNCGTIHTVAYDANGGTYGKDAAGNDIPGPEDMTKYYGTSIVVSSNTPTRIGYNFTQWKSDTTGTSYNPGTGYAYSQRGGTDTLKAQWKPITYTIHFDRNTPPGAVTEVTGNMADISQTYDVDSKLPKNAFKLDGCDFQGWNTKPDGSGDSYKDEEVIKNLTAKDGETITLYAQWKVTYKVVGSLNDVVSENFTDANGTTYGNITYGKMIRNNAVAAYKDGDCNGDGHLTTADAELITKYLNGEVTPTDKQKVAMDINGDGNITVSDRDKVLQLIEELTLTSSKKNVFTLMGTKLMCYDYPGYKIASSIKKTTDDVYIMGINDVTYSNTTTREVNIPEKIINSTFSDVIRFGTIHTIHFSPNDVTDGNGSTEATNVPDDITKYYGKDIKIPDAPKRDGYNFKGWTSDKTPDKIYQPGDTYNYAQRGGTDTLTAQWEPITYTIQFEKNKPASATHEVMYSMDNIGAVFDKAQNLPENQYKLAGWVFIGWNTKADGTGDFYADKAEVINLTIKDKDTVKLYAQWKNIDALPEGSKDGGNIPDDVPDSHGLMLRLNNNASLYSLEEEIREAMADTNGNLLYADNPDYEYLDVSDAAFSIVTTADKDICVYQTEGNKNSYYKVLNGESYIETTKSGKKILHKFVGWSVYKYATKSQSSQVIHTPGSNENMLDLIYEYQAVNELGLNDEGTPANSVLSDKADQIINRRDDLINAATDIADRKIVVYAIWDEYPLMQVKDIAILSTDFENIADKAILEEKIIKEIETAIITDKEDGNWNKGSNRDITVSIDQISLTNAYEFLKQRYEYIKDGNTIYSSTGATSVNIIVTDKTGNKTAQIIEVWLNAANPMVVEKPGNAENDPNPIKAVTSYVRAISREFYDKSEEEGGLLTASRWKTDDEYKTELINTFDILEKDDGYDQIWVFNANEVKEVQNYIKDNGLGNSEKIDGLSGFLEKFKSCRIYKK